MLHFTVPEHQFDESRLPDQREGVFSGGNEKFEAALAFAGKNIGFGSIKAGSNWIRSFGLHFHPLGKMENYGIDRESDGSRDVKVVRGEDLFSITGWTQLVGREIWSEVELVMKKVSLDLFFRIENFGPECPLALALFISCDRIATKDQEIPAGTLARFKGKAGSIRCVTQGGTLQITPHETEAMQIIPLAGKNHFWGANFLVAFEIGQFCSRYHITLS